MNAGREKADLSWDAMEGVLYAPPPPPPGLSLPAISAYVRAAAPGVSIAVVVGLAAAWIADHYGGPVMLFALLLGMSFHFLADEKRSVPGIDLAARGVLRLGVGLLGVRITVDQVSSLGFANLTLVVLAVGTTILFSLLAARVLKLEQEEGILSGGAVAICGVAAALAIASALPISRHLERNTIVTVIGVATLSTVAMIFYPALVAQAGLSNVTAGLFLGGTIHDVAQVVGAGYMISDETGEVSTIVKLLRVAMLVPVVLCLSIIFRKQNKSEGKIAIPRLPWFLVLFVVLVLVNSFGLLPQLAVEAGSTASRWCLLAAIAALGIKTSLKTLTEVGWRPVMLLGANTAFLAAFISAGLYLLA